MTTTPAKHATGAFASNTEQLSGVADGMPILPQISHDHNAQRTQNTRQSAGAIALLRARGVSDTTRAYFHIEAASGGWTYPASADLPATRFKGFPDNPKKYAWPNGKPEGLRFYDPRGALSSEIARSGGTLILAEGEADVWALYEGGIRNATATMLGAATVPAWLPDELARLGVARVILYPDRDSAGYAFAANVTRALGGTPIIVEARELPAELGEKGDVGDLLLAVGARGLEAALEACGPAHLPDPAPEPVTRRGEAYSAPQADPSGLFEQWAVEVERAAVAAWNIAPPKANGWSRRNFNAPTREDRRASCTWDYTKHGYKDHAGPFYRTYEVAEQLGFTPWSEWKAQHAPILRPAGAPGDKTPTRFALGMPYTLTKRLNMAARLFGLPSQTPAALVLHAWQAIPRDVLPDDAALTQADFRRAAAGVGFELSRRVAMTGLDQLAEWSMVTRIDPPNCDHDSGAKCSFCNLYLTTSNKYRLQNDHLGTGSPPTFYLFNPASVALRGFVDRYTQLIAARRYGDTPADAVLVWRDLTADEILLADALSAGLYEATEDARHEAALLFEADLADLRADAARIVAGENYHTANLATGVIDSPAAYVRSLTAGLLEAAGEKGTPSHVLRNLTGVSRATAARIVADLGALSIPQERQVLVRDLTPRDLPLVKREDGEKAVLYAPSVVKLASAATPAETDQAARYAAAQQRRAALRRAHRPQESDHSAVKAAAAAIPRNPRKQRDPVDPVKAWQRLQLDLRLPEGFSPYDAATGELYGPGQLFRLATDYLTQRENTPSDAPQAPPRAASAPVVVELRPIVVKRPTAAETAAGGRRIVTKDGKRGLYLPSGTFWEFLEGAASGD